MNTELLKHIVPWVAAVALWGCRPPLESHPVPVPVDFAGRAESKAFAEVVDVAGFTVFAYSNATTVPSVFIDRQSYPFKQMKYWPVNPVGGFVGLDFIGVYPFSLPVQRIYDGNAVVTTIPLNPREGRDVLYFHTFWESMKSPVVVNFNHVYNRIRKVGFEALHPDTDGIVVNSLVMKDYVESASLLLRTDRESSVPDRYECGVGSREEIVTGPFVNPYIEPELLIVPGTYSFEVDYTLEKYGQRKSYSKEFSLELVNHATGKGGTAYDLRLLLGDDIVRANLVGVVYSSLEDGAVDVREDFHNPYRLWIASASGDWAAAAYATYISNVADNVLQKSGMPGMDAGELSDFRGRLENREYPIALPADFPDRAAAMAVASEMDERINGAPLYINPGFVYEVRLESQGRP